MVSFPVASWPVLILSILPSWQVLDDRPDHVVPVGVMYQSVARLVCTRCVLNPFEKYGYCENLFKFKCLDISYGRLVGWRAGLNLDVAQGVCDISHTPHG